MASNTDDASEDAAVDTPLSFTDFLERMKDPAAADLVRSIRAFVKSFDDQPPDAERDAPRVQAFFDRADEAFRAHPAWQGASAAVLTCAGEGLEKYVLTKIHARVFGANALDAERDEALSQRLSALSFVKPEHLEIPASHVGAGGETSSSSSSSSSPAARALALAQRELSKVNSFKAPRDKLVCILNACRVLSDSLAAVAAREDEERRRKRAENGNETKPPSTPTAATAPKPKKSSLSASSRGADDFLPLLIYALIKANPPRIASNLEYIQRFRGNRRFHGEAAYFFTQLYAAASFVETVNSSSLAIDPDEFVARMVDAGVPDMQLLPPPRSVVEAALASGSEDGGEGGGGGERQKEAAKATISSHVASHPQLPARTASAAAEAEENPAFWSNHLDHLRPSTAAATETTTKKEDNTLRHHRSSSSFLPPPTSKQLELEGAELVLAADASGELDRDHRFLCSPSEANDLSLADVSELLRLYKEQVLRCEAISRAADARARRWEEEEGESGKEKGKTTRGVAARNEEGEEQDSVPSPPWVPPSTTTAPPVADLDLGKLSLLPVDAEEEEEERGEGEGKALPPQVLLSDDIAHLLTPTTAAAPANAASASASNPTGASGAKEGTSSASLI